MKHIGGFFELEQLSQGGGSLHPAALGLHTGRSCLLLMLSTLSPLRVYVPYYACDALLAPFRKLNVEIIFYGLDRNFYPIGITDLKDGEYLLYTNYFGLCEDQIDVLITLFGIKLLVDDTHAFFHGRRDNIWSFTSARKFFGVPDGAYLYAPEQLKANWPDFENISIDHLHLRKNGQQAEAFVAFQQYENSLGCQLLGMSKYSAERLNKIDYASAANIRRQNYLFLASYLDKNNLLNINIGDSIPFCYPYLPKKTIKHELLYENKIYPPKLWPDFNKHNAPIWEIKLANNLLPLPIDHRYDINNMKTILNSLGVFNEQ